MNIILIPTYNERGNISGLISDIRRHAGAIEIMVIDDNSPDGTADCVVELMRSDQHLRLLRRKKKDGLGAAYVDALRTVKGEADIDAVITMDADGSHDPACIPIMLDALTRVDIAVGSRYIRGGGVENWGWHRWLLSRLGNMYSGFVLHMPIRDLTAGFVCFRKKLLDSINLDAFHASGYAYQIEFKYACIKAGFSCEEIPIIFKERKIGKSKMSFSIIAGGIITPLRLRLRS